ncbi:hypothetical protein A4A49_07261 [Nicotiana attenuata]|uniref:Uncharacterized protein n=1 Tax=Nicotiana attenuata TaxID=49451 RepID=A0A1J6J9H0_NICAT|nr:hypothetical protein A4A49_07261 [Nicotiana attenuata]
MVEEIPHEEYTEQLENRLQFLMAQSKSYFDRMNGGLDVLNQKMDKILEMLGISLEDKGIDYHVLKEDQESAGKEIEVGESGDQEVPSSCGILSSVDVPNEHMVEILKLEEASVRKSSPLEIAGKFNGPNEYVEIVVSQLISISIDLESLFGKPNKVGQCAKNFKCIITGNLIIRSHDSNDAPKLFDELLESDATHVSCLFLQVSNSLLYGPEEQNDETIVAFDPGGNTFTMFDVSYMKLDVSSFLSILGVCSQLRILSCTARITLDWLNQLKELPNGVKIKVDTSVPLFMYSLDYAKVQLANCAKTTNK